MHMIKYFFEAKFLGLHQSDVYDGLRLRIKPERPYVRFIQDTYPAFYVNTFYSTGALAVGILR